MKTKQLATDSMLSAMCTVLGCVAIDLGNIKITFEGIPIIIGALLFGPTDGAAIGFIGTLICQLLRYGLSVTTLLWILPYVACGLIVGLYTKRRNFSLSMPQTVFIVALSELIVTTLNTGALYADSRIYGYYYPTLILGALALRYIICIVKAIAVGTLLPALIELLNGTILRKRQES